MIRLIESNRGLGPSRVLWDSRTYSVDFLARKLELTRVLVGVGSTVDQHDCLLSREGCRDISP
jgi:hypothetical protein